MPIQQILVDETAEFIDGYVKKAVVTINGTDVDYPIHKTIYDGKRIKKLVYLQSETGRITGAKIVDAHGRDLQTKDIDINKDGNGLVIAFVIEVKTEGK